MKKFLISLLVIGFFNCALADFTAKTIEVDHGHIFYYQIGRGKPILLLHGLFANKEQWLGIVKKLQKIDPNLTSQYQFIIPDLPGYGASTDYPIQVYNLDSSHKTNSLNQVQLLHDFLTQLSVTQPISLAGSSMGGLLMTLYAAHYPKSVKSLAYIGSPAGLVDFTPQFIDTGFRQGYNPLIPTSISEFKNELRLLLINYSAVMPSDEIIQKKITPQIKKTYQQRTATFNMLYIKRYRDYLTQLLPLTQPTLVLWGDKDYIFGSARNAKNLCQHLPKSSCHWYALPNAGHLLLLENDKTLEASARAYYQFLMQQSH